MYTISIKNASKCKKMRQRFANIKFFCYLCTVFGKNESFTAEDSVRIGHRSKEITDHSRYSPDKPPIERNEIPKPSEENINKTIQ
jgi:hypothetical protein